MRIILTDIEGTTSSVSFVVDVLFPYAAQHLPQFLLDHHREADVLAEIESVRELAGEPDATIDRVTAILQGWIAEDKKITPLKALQGMIWQKGYENGELNGHVYEDVPAALARWQAAGYTLAVYSSGSIAAQKLIFGHTAFGDLTRHFSAYFDTTSGGKRETASYRNIAQALNVDPSRIVFLSDIQQELDAASDAGCRTIGLERTARGVIHGHRVETSFDAIDPDACF